jgi:predicted Na+-dependent transporter
MQSKLLVVGIVVLTLAWSIALAALLHIPPAQALGKLALPIAIVPFVVWASASSYGRYRQRHGHKHRDHDAGTAHPPGIVT